MMALHAETGNWSAAISQATDLIRLAPKFTPAQLEKTFTTLSARDEHKPKRLLNGMKKAFAAAAAAK